MSSQILQKPYDCMTCGQQIKISKIDGAGPDAKKKWNRYEMDGVTPDVCNKEKKQQQQQQDQQQQRYFVAEEKRLVNLDENRLVNIEKTLASLKTDVRSLIMQMQLLRQELDKLKK